MGHFFQSEPSKPCTINVNVVRAAYMLVPFCAATFCVFLTVRPVLSTSMLSSPHELSKFTVIQFYLVNLFLVVWNTTFVRARVDS